jgi:flavin reductase (DIM6/NTAB) family NADH-FMN oxidoreductase RutF
MNELEPMFRRSMRALTSAVSIISTAVTSVSMSPPSLLTCINKTASLHDPLIRCAQFYVNVVHAYKSDLAGAFSRKAAERRFLNGKWNLDLHGLPYPLGAQANILCEMESILRYGSHTIVLGLVRATACDPVDPLHATAPELSFIEIAGRRNGTFEGSSRGSCDR